MFRWTLRKIKVRRNKSKKLLQKLEFLKHHESARAIVYSRLAHFNLHYKFIYKVVRIKSQASRWGSCSSIGNLNFNYKIAFLPSYLADYIIVHELCHIGEFNHSRNFWNLVSETIPDYKRCRIALKSWRK